MKVHRIILLVIILIGAFWRFWNFENRWMLLEGSARELVSYRYGASNNLIAIYNPVNWHKWALGQMVRKDLPVYAPWLFLGLISLATVPAFYLVGKKIFGRKYGIFCALVVAFASQIIEMSVEFNLLSLGLFFLGIGLYLTLNKRWLGIPLVVYGLSFGGEIQKNIGLLLFDNKEASYVLAGVLVVCIGLVYFKHKEVVFSQKWLIVPMCIILGIINPLAFYVVAILAAAFCFYVVYELVPNKELLLWIGIGTLGFWSMQNQDLLWKNGQNQTYLEAKKFIDTKIQGGIKFYEFDNSRASVLPLMYLYMQEGRLSEEGTKVAILHDSLQIQVYLWRDGIEPFVRGVSAQEVKDGKY